MADVPTHPVQVALHVTFDGAKKCVAPQVVTLAAYEVYCEVYAPQDAIIQGDCRGGFSVGELIALLYARSFPREEWKMRVDEGHNGLRLSGR